MERVVLFAAVFICVVKASCIKNITLIYANCKVQWWICCNFCIFVNCITCFFLGAVILNIVDSERYNRVVKWYFEIWCIWWTIGIFFSFIRVIFTFWYCFDFRSRLWRIKNGNLCLSTYTITRRNSNNSFASFIGWSISPLTEATDVSVTLYVKLVP